MDRIRDYNQRKAYVEIALGNMLKAQRGFDFIRFVRAFRTEEDYIRIGDLRGCTVTFDVNGGDELDPNSVSGEYDSSITLPAATKTGATFLGWQHGTETYAANLVKAIRRVGF